MKRIIDFLKILQHSKQAALTIGLAIVSIALYGMFTFKSHEKPVRTSSKPGKKKYVKESILPASPHASLHQSTETEETVFMTHYNIF